MARAPERKTGSPTGSLLIGVSFFALAAYWPELTGAHPGAGDQFYLGFFKFIGAMAMLGGLAGYYKAWRQRQKRKQAEAPSGTFGEAAFATLDECAQAGLLQARGLYLGLLDGQPLFYSGKAHLLTVAPARQGKGINVVIPNLLHFQGSVFVTDPKGELAAVTAAHRAERLGQKVYVLNPWGIAWPAGNIAAIRCSRCWTRQTIRLCFAALLMKPKRWPCSSCRSRKIRRTCISGKVRAPFYGQ